MGPPGVSSGPVIAVRPGEDPPLSLALLAAFTGFCAGCWIYRLGAGLRGIRTRRVDEMALAELGIADATAGERVVAFTHPLCTDCGDLLAELRAAGHSVSAIDVRERPDLARKYGVAVVPMAFTVDHSGAVLNVRRWRSLPERSRAGAHCAAVSLDRQHDRAARAVADAPGAQGDRRAAQDLHALFDAGYVTVTPSLELRVSRRICEEFENGRDYYALEGASVRVPLPPAPPPSPEYLEWHGVTRGSTPR